MPTNMNGAESLVRTLVAAEVDACFTNPGTSEMHIVAALDGVREMRCVLGLFEGVATGAADGYARMTGKPACTLLHLGPGLANGGANLHNAKRARVPMVNIVGQHPISHLCYDPPLASDVEGIARPFSKWVHTSRTSAELGRDAAAATVAARTAPGQIATLIVPADAAWNDGGVIAAKPVVPKAPLPSIESINHAAAMLRVGLPTALLLAGNTLHGEGLAVAGRIAAATGARLLAPYPITRVQRGAGSPSVQRIPYMHEQAADLLKGFRQLILVGAAVPVDYFASPGRGSELTPSECEVHTLANPGEDYLGALDALSTALSLEIDAPFVAEKADRTPVPAGDITLPGLAAAIAAVLPEGAIVVDEAMTSGRGIMAATRGAPPHDWLGNTGGSIGIAFPLAVGAAVACPTRRVLCLTADGSGMYTAQALWTMAREGLNISNVVFANRTYAVLQREFLGLGIGAPGPRAADLLDIGRPTLDWVRLGEGMGVPGSRVTSLDAFARALRQGFESDGPTLIEVPL
jgi:acetolactate synthase I/II/III large subunit